ncbi:MAG: hypothetical protein HQL74_11860 [Magnetococcales bacterium]|nr:hypothetical protein [Magnetococcales bacterium]
MSYRKMFDIVALKKRQRSSTLSSSSETLESVPKEVKEFLLVRIGSMGWWCQRYNLQCEPIGVVATGEWLGLDPHDSSRLPQVILSFVTKGLNPRRWAATLMVVLLEGGSQLCFSDGLGENLAKSSKGAIREFGRTMLNLPDVSFGSDPLLKTRSGLVSGGIYAFAGVPFIKECLDAFGKKGLHLYRLVPVEYAMLRQLQQTTEAPCAALYVGAFETSLLLCHPVLGARTIQHLPFGILTLVTQIRKKKRLNDQQALEKLADNDFIPGQSSSVLPTEIAEAFNLLVQRINHSLDYFEQQRICGRPEFMELHGEFYRIHGFAHWLQSQLNLEMRVPDPERILELVFIKEVPELRFSLLQGLVEGICILQVSGVRYTMTKDGILSINHMENTRIISQGLEARQAEDRHKARRLARRKESQSRRREIIENLRYRFNDWLSRRQVGTSPTDAVHKWIRRYQLRIVAVALVILAMTGGYFFHRDLEMTHEQLLTSQKGLAEQRQTLTKIVNQLEQENNGLANATPTLPGFMRWSEKITQLGNLIEPNMWVNGLSLTARPSDKDKWSGYLLEMSIDAGLKKRAEVSHIMDITHFTERLQRDAENFMVGFDQVTMHNTRSEKKDNEELFQFSVSVSGHDPALNKTVK